MSVLLARRRCSRLTKPRDFYFISAIDDAERVEQPYDHADDYDDIENLLDFAVHRNVGIDQPQQYSNYN